MIAAIVSSGMTLHHSMIRRPPLGLVAAWQSCVAEPGPLSESIEVNSSHLGIAWHPSALLTIADRLAQPEGRWNPFRAPRGWRWPFGPRVMTAHE
jgi:hypothetical protein